MAISELNISGAKSLSTNRARTPYGKKKKKIPVLTRYWILKMFCSMEGKYMQGGKR
jgi:hypothetical protein